MMLSITRFMVRVLQFCGIVVAIIVSVAGIAMLHGCGVETGHADGGVSITSQPAPDGATCYVFYSNGTPFAGSCK